MSLKIDVVIASINELSNLYNLKEWVIRMNHKVKVIVVDEGDEKIRGRNSNLLQGLQYEFYGPKERGHWFK